MIKNILKHSVALMLAGLALPAAAQDMKVEGTVVDGSTGESLPGARVTILNGEGAAMTGDKGLFSITAPGSGAILRVEIPGLSAKTDLTN